MIVGKPNPGAFEASHDAQALLTIPPPLHSWSVTRANAPRASIWIWPIALTIWPIFAIVMFRDMYTDFFITYAIFISGSILTSLFILSGALNRTEFNYNIYPEKGELDYCRHHFKYTRAVYRCITGTGILTLLAVGIYAESILFFLGSGGAMILTALRLSSWEPPPTEYETSLPWHEYNYVTIDRYFLILAVHVDEEHYGFEARLPNKELFDQYLAFLRTVLPPTVQYREGIWWGYTESSVMPSRL